MSLFSTQSSPPQNFGPLPIPERVVLTLSLLAVTAGGWTWMLLMDWEMRQMMSGGAISAWMPPGVHGVWDSHDFWMLFVMWTVMMVAMMTPSALPTVRMYHTVSRKHVSITHPVLSWALFLLGYLAAWVLFSGLVTLMQWPLHFWGMLDPMMNSKSFMFSGTLIVIAGVYQWTPWKDACLNQCRSPLQFLMAHWHSGTFGAWRMGAENGIFCVGCCWALMLVLFALGMMNMLWVALITLFVLLEKTLPGPSPLFRGFTGLGLVGIGGWFLWRAAEIA